MVWDGVGDLMMKVAVLDVAGNPLGMGIHLGLEEVQIIDDDGTPMGSITTPRIVMEEDGEIMYGYECWWIPI